jgi:hypothetical protein
MAATDFESSRPTIGANHMPRLSIAICFLLSTSLLVTACGESFESPEHFYVQLEKKWCDGENPEELWEKYYVHDDTTFQYFQQISNAYKGNPEIQKECASFDRTKQLAETKSQQKGANRFALMGKTQRGDFRQLPNHWILKTDDGYRLQLKWYPN